jgi:hypothetical protein
MNKTKKNFIFALVGLSILMMTAASVSADAEPNLIAPNPNTTEDPNLIAPSPDTNEEPNLIAPRDILGNKDASSGDNNFTTGLILVIGIAGIAGLAAALIIFKKKN